MKKIYLILICLFMFGASIAAQPLNQSSLPRAVTVKPTSCVSSDKKQALIVFQNRIWECIGNVYVRETDAKVGTITAGTNITVSRTGDNVTVNASGGGSVGTEVSLSNTYGNSLATAVATIGATKTTLLIDADTTLSSAVTIPATLTLKQKNQAKIIESGTATITFGGLGLENWESRVPIFALFEDGDIQFTGTVTPPTISADLWDETNWGEKTNRAATAFTNKTVKIVIYSGGTPVKQVRIRAFQSPQWTAGTYENAISQFATGTPYGSIIIESNTTMSGDGMYRSYIKESSFVDVSNDNLGAALMVASSLHEGTNHSGTNENIIVEDLGFLGQPEQRINSGLATVLVGNCKNFAIRRNSTNRTHGFSFFAGANSDPNPLEGNAIYYAQDGSITDNVVRGARTQAIGTIGGRNILIARNLIADVNPSLIVKTVTTNATTTTITSATGGFGAWTTGATVRLNRTGQAEFVGTVISSPNANTIVLNAAVSYSAADAVVELTGTTAALIDIEPNTVFTYSDNIVISNNVIDGRTSRQSWSGITVHAGGYRAQRNITVTNNTIIGRDLTGATPDLSLGGSNNVGFMTYGISLSGVNTGVIKGNYIQGNSQTGINADFSRRIHISENSMLAVGDPNHAMTLTSMSDSTISNNIIDNTFPNGYNGSQSDVILETETSGAVSVAGAVITKLVTNPENLVNFQPFQQNLKITILGVDYTIASVAENRQSATLTVAPAAAASVTATTKFSNNKYIHNKSGTITLAAGSASVINAIGAGGSGGLDAAGVRATDLTGLGAGSAAPIAATDTFISAFAKTKFQFANPNANSYSVQNLTFADINGSGRMVLGNTANDTIFSFNSLFYFRDSSFLPMLGITKTSVTFDRDAQIGFSGTANDALAAKVVGLKREAPGILAITDGGTGFGSLRLGLITPASSTAACTAGTFSVDANFLYLCTALNTWKRSALTSF